MWAQVSAHWNPGHLTWWSINNSQTDDVQGLHTDLSSLWGNGVPVLYVEEISDAAESVSFLRENGLALNFSLAATSKIECAAQGNRLGDALSFSIAAKL